MPKGLSKQNHKYLKQFSFNLLWYRKERDLTQYELAEKVGISNEHYSRLESPEKIVGFSAEVLFNLARALEIEPYQLLRPIQPEKD